jgi:hypothetical protein
MRVYVRCTTWIDPVNNRRCYAAMEDGKLAIHIEGRSTLLIPFNAASEITRCIGNYVGNRFQDTAPREKPDAFTSTAEVSNG